MFRFSQKSIVHMCIVYLHQHFNGRVIIQAVSHLFLNTQVRAQLQAILLDICDGK